MNKRERERQTDRQTDRQADRHRQTKCLKGTEEIVVWYNNDFLPHSVPYTHRLKYDPILC